MSKAPLPQYTIFQKLKLFFLGIIKWDIPTYTTGDELFKLYNLANSLKSKSVGIEIGSYIGASTLMIAKGLNNESILYCIDTWENDAMSEGKWDTLAVFKKNTETIAQKIILVKLKSLEASINFSDKIDFIFIDGDHSYEGVKADVNAWFPKLKSGGIIAMHDIGWADGVLKVVEEDVKPYLNKFDQLPNMFWGWKI